MPAPTVDQRPRELPGAQFHGPRNLTGFASHPLTLRHTSPNHRRMTTYNDADGRSRLRGHANSNRFDAATRVKVSMWPIETAQIEMGGPAQPLSWENLPDRRDDRI